MQHSIEESRVSTIFKLSTNIRAQMLFLGGEVHNRENKSSPKSFGKSASLPHVGECSTVC